jgi:hypothetical protein
VFDFLITESIYLRLGLDRPASGRMGQEAVNIERALHRLCALSAGTTVIVRNRAMRVVGPDPSQPEHGTCVLPPRQGTRINVQIVVEPVDKPRQWISLRFAILENWKKAPNEPQWLLEVEFNPTTLENGNNVLPATIPDPETGVLPRFPSSAPRVMRALNRSGFDFLDEISRQTGAGEQALFRADTRRAIGRGDFEIVRAQFCSYFPTPSVSRFLQTMAILFGQTIGSGTGVVQLADYLGLLFRPFTNPNTNIVTGVMFQKFHGKKPVYSLVFYNKMVRLAQMRQTTSLSKTELTTARNNVRFDMTLHKLGILELISAAQTALKKLRKDEPTLFDNWPEAFLGQAPRVPTAWWLERAIFVLSHARRGKVLIRESFADWLVPKMINRVLRLDVTSRFTSRGLHALLDLPHAVVKVWRELDAFQLHDSIGAVARLASIPPSTAYSLRQKWIRQFGIDISVPFAYYRDALSFGPMSVTTPGNRAELNAAVTGNDGVAAVRTLRAALNTFHRTRTEVVGAAIAGRPHLMQAQSALASATGPAVATNASSPGLTNGQPSLARGLVVTHRLRSSNGAEHSASSGKPPASAGGSKPAVLPTGPKEIPGQRTNRKGEQRRPQR